MRILLVNRFFGGEQVPTGRMLRDVADELLRRGHLVEVFTSRSSYIGAFTEKHDESGVRVHSLWSGPSRIRVLQWFFFWVQVWTWVPFSRWDRCVILTDPPFMHWSALLCRVVGRRGLYWWTMDLYPEALVASGLIAHTGVANRILSAITNCSLPFLDGVICLGTRQRQLLSNYSRWACNADYSIVVPPWDFRSLAEVPCEENLFRKKHGLDNKRIALYAGNLGEAHSFEPILDAAAALERTGDKSWHFTFVVRGSQRAALERAAKGLGNVSVLDYEPLELTPHMLWAADVHLITLRDGWDGVVVPSKLYGILSTGAPLLFIGPEKSDTSLVIDQSKLGIVLASSSTGSEVAMAVQSASSMGRQKRTISRNGPGQIVDFVCR